MNFGGYLGESTIDYPGKLGPVLFSSGCNYKCPACHNPELVNKNLILNKEYITTFMNMIKLRKDFIKGITISGGEPTIQAGLPFFLKDLKKELGLPIKLDTNGSNYQMLGELLENKLVDYISLDVKGPTHLYADLIGREHFDTRDGIEKSISIVTQFPNYEFRTTIVPIVRRNGEISFLTPEEIKNTAELIDSCIFSNDKENKYFLQKFIPAKTGLLDKKLEEFPETPDKLMQECYEAAKEILPSCKIR
ncbi:MAG: anaerobic ribonucleoside-triphosphate reductase activating protein [Candidatus Nanoarchaeia archaeon]